MTKSKQVKKTDYEIFAFFSGYYGIINTKTREIVFGGDSANFDCYNMEFIKSVFKNWNGKLISYDNKRYYIEL